jgi:hypothetical protein
MSFLARIRREPVAFQAVVQMALAFGCAFGLKLTAEQTAASLALSAAVLAFFTRRAVSPVRAACLHCGRNLP